MTARPRFTTSLLLVSALACRRETPPEESKAEAPATAGPKLLDVGPRIVSNQTAYPISLHGEGLGPGWRLRLIGAGKVELPTRFLSEDELTAWIPPDAMQSADPSLEVFDLRLELVDAKGQPIAGGAQLSVVNDQDFLTPGAFAMDLEERRAFVTSKTTDELLVVERATGALSKIEVGDGPVGLDVWRGKDGAWIVVSHENEGALMVLRADRPDERFVIPVPARSRGLAVRGDRAYLANQLEDAVLEIDLVKREILRRIPVGVNPGAIAADGKRLAVGHHGSDDLSIVALPVGPEQRLVPAPGLPIIGGHTEPYAKYIMGGKVPRALVAEERTGLVFAATLGPNIGPNPDRMEVSMNGGISVIDAAAPRFLRHVSLLRGVPEALALDEARGLLYAADIATGRVVVLDAKRLAKDDQAAREAILGALELEPPSDARLVRPKEDFSVNGRSGTSIHTGPGDIKLVDRGRSLLVLCRFSRELVELDVREASKGKIVERRRHRLHEGKDQETRRLGEILYFTDLGNGRMTCDTCHPSGHAGGVLFTKGRPIRIYRSPSIRGARESPPFFTPTKLRTLYDMSRQVLARNRYDNPVPTTFEKRALTLYSTLMPTPPNPYRGTDGAPPERMSLPDGAFGVPMAGRSLFHGKGGCAVRQCHPPPHYTADQDPKTRGLLHHVGTPLALGLRQEMQDMEPDYGWPAPALVGVWDYFPLLMSGAGGLEVNPEGVLEARHPFALRRVLEGPIARQHGGMSSLSASERNDLLAFLLSL